MIAKLQQIGNKISSEYHCIRLIKILKDKIHASYTSLLANILSANKKTI